MKFCSKIKAFTLIELLVSISILAMMAAVSVSSYPKFSEQMGVSAETFKMLAFMREAQVYGSSGYTEPGVKVVYGMEIDSDTNILKKVQWQNPNSTTNQSYVDNKVDTGENMLALNDRYKISKMCSVTAGASSCDTGSSFNKTYIFFRRPNPEARLLGLVGNILYPNQNTSTGLLRLEIHIQSKLNPQFEKKIVILQTGQMYVE